MKRLAGLLLVLLSACVTPASHVPPPRVGPYPPTLPVHYLAVWVTDSNGPVVGASVDVTPVVLGAPVQFAETNADGWSGQPATQGDYAVHVEREGYKPVDAVATVLKHTDVHVRLERVRPPTLPVRVDGRFWTTDAGTFRPQFQSGLALLTKAPAERDAFLDQAVALGFNGIRVFAGDLGWAGQTPLSARAALPSLLDAAQARGLYVYVCALTGGGYDVEAHLAQVAQVVSQHPNAILEAANEIGHPTQSDLGKDPARLLAVARRVIPAGVLWTLGALNGVDEPDPQGHYAADGGLFNDAHLDRGRDLFNQVRRVRELAALSEATRRPVMSGEPIGIAEDPMPGKQRLWGGDAATFAFAYGVLCRGFEVGCVFHSEQGLNGQLLGPNTQAAARAFLDGARAIETSDRLQFVNAGWAGSPVAAADFDNGLVRAYSFIAGARGWTVLVGVKGDPKVQWGGGWSPRRTVVDRSGVRVLEIGR